MVTPFKYSHFLIFFVSMLNFRGVTQRLRFVVLEKREGGVLRWPRAQVHHPTADFGCQDTGAGGEFGLSSCLALGGLAPKRKKLPQNFVQFFFLQKVSKACFLFLAEEYVNQKLQIVNDPFWWRLNKRSGREARRVRSHVSRCHVNRPKELPIRYAQRILQIEALPGWQASRELVEEGRGVPEKGYERIGDVDGHPNGHHLSMKGIKLADIYQKYPSNCWESKGSSPLLGEF